MVSFLTEVKIFRFWPKTMDYNKAFSIKIGQNLTSPKHYKKDIM